MSFADLIRQILRANPEGMTPQQIRETVKSNYPTFYGTESHRRNVEKGHYKGLDHALLAQIYVASRTGGQVVVDKTQKPIRLTVRPSGGDDVSVPDEDIDTENLERMEAGVGTLYILGTHLYTKDGLEIVKIGITTGSVESRITQLCTTGVPFRFRVIKSFETRNYYELEQAAHRLLDPYRINQSREFFTEKCLPYIEQLLQMHKSIQDTA